MQVGLDLIELASMLSLLRLRKTMLSCCSVVGFVKWVPFFRSYFLNIMLGIGDARKRGVTVNFTCSAWQS